MDLWTVFYGWHAWYGRTPDPTSRPAHIEPRRYHSLEAAIKTWPPGSWWEVAAPDGQVVVSSVDGFNREASAPLTLCARQILADRFPGLFPESLAKPDGFDLASDDDGETWRPILLGAKGTGSPRSDGDKASDIPAGRVLDIRLSANLADPSCFTIRHRTGQISLPLSAVEVRQAASGRYDLTVTGPKGSLCRGTYAAGIDAGVVQAARDLGVVVRDYRSAKDAGGRRLPKSWRSGLFEIRQTGVDGEECPAVTVRGFVRGSLGLDRRTVRCKGYGDCYYNREMWCLTHLPTGYMILSRKHRRAVEEVADRLRAAVPELTDAVKGAPADISRETLDRARAVVQADEW